MFLRTLLTTFLFAFSVVVFAQTKNEVAFKYHIKKTSSKIKLDGDLGDEGWKVANRTPPFRQQFPYDTATATDQTEAYLTFDDDNIYVGFVCYQKREYRVQSLKRDFPQGGGSDLVFVNFDTFKDKQNSFHFAVNPYGVQREALVFNGNEITNDWDNAWKTSVKNYDDRWVVESAIPFKTLRYKLNPSGINEWNVQFFRNNLSINERSSWAPMPRNVRGNDLAFLGTLVWDDAPPKPNKNIVLIPYAIGSTNKDYQNATGTTTANAGFDAKVAVTPSLNLDLTFNPDFSQVEVDRQVTNLSRFELLFPERRQFFIENSDLFGSFGLPNVSPFFSRRIGITKNTVTSNNEQVGILGGARLSGKLNNSWRVGLLNLQTREKMFSTENGIASANYMVAAVQRKVLTRSNVGVIMVNKENFLTQSEIPKLADVQAFHRILGIDFNHNSANGRWKNKYFFHQALTPTSKPGQNTGAVSMTYDSPKAAVDVVTSFVGENYTAAVGYVPRQNFVRNESNLNYIFYPKSKLINNWGLGIDWDYFVRATDQKRTDMDFSPLVLQMRFQSNATLRFVPFRSNYTYLMANFDPTNIGATPLKKDTEYRYRQVRGMYMSSPNRLFFCTVSGIAGEYFNGNIQSLGVMSNYRIMPYALLSLDVNYNNIKLPVDYQSAKLWLVSPRAEVTFTKSVFLTTFLQYNNQTNNVNLNTRLQWRFKPVSDLFLVYTDNYFATDPLQQPNMNLGPLNSKNRSLVLKFTYWLNV
jgi:hypothetical protein